MCIRRIWTGLVIYPVLLLDSKYFYHAQVVHLFVVAEGTVRCGREAREELCSTKVLQTTASS